MKNLFNNELSRLDVLSYKNVSKNIRNIKIMIHRNHSFEMISNIINKFLNYFELNAEFLYSSYDDSLTFPTEMDADLHILWLDLNRYNQETVKSFIEEKINELYALTKKPIILGCIGNSNSIENNIANIININKIVSDLGDKAFDLEKEKYSGTRLSAKASIKIAQYLGLKIIPSYFTSQIKAIVTDLDNTFYKGILGEDGVKNLIPYQKYQNKLKELSQKGYMVCISSKNDEDEVQSLFNNRNDFELKYDDFTCKRINWNLKAENISDMAKQMNIGLDSILFIDDNIAEIESVKVAIPQIKAILFENEEDILNKLNLYPGFLKSSVTQEDLLRSQDIKANEQRNNLAKTLSKEEYFNKLGIKIELALNEPTHSDRITELLNKTNQFILSYRRYNKSEVENLLNSQNSCIVTAKMSDNLSDSGIIAILICKNKNNNLFVDELTFSCRALGRNIEDIVISKMLQISKEYLKTTNNIQINYEKGARNIPALNWLKDYTKSELSEKGIISYVLNEQIETYGLEMKVLCQKH